MVPLPTLAALDPGLTIAVVSISIDLIAIITVGLHMVQSQTQITKLHFMVVRQSNPIKALIWKFAWSLVVRGAETIIALVIRLLMRL